VSPVVLTVLPARVDCPLGPRSLAGELDVGTEAMRQAEPGARRVNADRGQVFPATCRQSAPAICAVRGDLQRHRRPDQHGGGALDRLPANCA